jgi:putative pyruvate formate lyase activating enzyme
VNRLNDELGECGVGRWALVSSYGPHFGEEPELVGSGGSGTIFFAGCNLHCSFCQNYDISQKLAGVPLKPDDLARRMLSIQAMGCHNLNLVSPTHVIAQILEAICLAAKDGFSLPVVYNSGGYDDVTTLKLLGGVIDIYMPDAKYSDDATADRLSRAPNYWAVNQQALKEMHRQVGDLIVSDGIARHGLIIRHLILPHRLAGSQPILDFIRNELSPETYVNLMAQYYPCYRAYDYPELSHRITRDEYEAVIGYAKKIGLHRGF